MKLSVSTSAKVHVVIAAALGAVVPVLAPVVDHGVSAVTLQTLDMAAGAGIAAVLRSLLLLVPTK